MNRAQQVLSDLYRAVADTMADEGVAVCRVVIGAASELTGEPCVECGSGTCGTAFVSVEEVAPAVDPVLQARSPYTQCGSELVMRCTAGVMRCFPVGDEMGPADEGDVAGAVLDMLGDMTVLHKALTCTYEGDVALGSWRPVGQQGGCAGGYWSFQAPLGL